MNYNQNNKIAQITSQTLTIVVKFHKGFMQNSEWKKIRDLLSEDLQTVQGQILNWIDRYFPEFLTVFKKWEGKAALQFLKLYVLPHELVKYSDQAKNNKDNICKNNGHLVAPTEFMLFKHL